jgi:hypothetical protein
LRYGIVSAYMLSGPHAGPRGKEVEAMTYAIHYNVGDVAMAVMAWTVCIATGILVAAFLLNL